MTNVRTRGYMVLDEILNDLDIYLASDSFIILSDNRSKTSSKTIPPHSAESFLLQMRVSSPVLKVIQ